MEGGREGEREREREMLEMRYVSNSEILKIASKLPSSFYSGVKFVG